MEQSVQIVNSEDLKRKDGFYLTVNLLATNPQAATQYGLFFTARHPMEILYVSEVHDVACDSTGTLDIEKLTGTTALHSGTSILTTTFALNSTARIPVVKQQSALSSARQLKEGDRLALKAAGTITAVKDVQVTLYCKFLGRGDYK